MLNVEVITGGLSVNIMDDWLQAPSVSCSASRLQHCPVCWPQSDSDVEALSHQLGLERRVQVFASAVWVTQEEKQQQEDESQRKFLVFLSCD